MALTSLCKMTALELESSNGDERTVKRLLEEGLNANQQGEDYYGNALQAASANGYEQIVQLLLRNGADVKKEGGKYGNAIEAATAMSGLSSFYVKLLMGSHTSFVRWYSTGSGT
jgi:ankyrin repeat protein